MQTDVLQCLSKSLSAIGNIKAAMSTQCDGQSHLQSARTAGHSFHGPGPVIITSTQNQALKKQGKQLSEYKH